MSKTKLLLNKVIFRKIKIDCENVRFFLQNGDGLIYAKNIVDDLSDLLNQYETVNDDKSLKKFALDLRKELVLSRAERDELLS